MFRKALRTVWIAGLLIAIAAVPSWPSVGRDGESFEGTWEGKLEVIGRGPNKDPDADERTKAAYGKSPFKITIHGQRADVYFGEMEVKPASFQAQVLMTNAVVFASSTGEDQDGKWVETWDFALTQKNSEALIVCFSRVVNNLSGSKFFVLATGELHRASY